MTAHKDVNEVDTSSEEIDRDMAELLNRHDIELDPHGESGEGSPPGQTSDDAALDIRPLLALPIKMTFAVLCPNWTITEGEVNSLADAYGDVIDYYFPDINLGPAAGAILATGIVIASHAGEPRRVSPPEPEPENEA
jgi:hypothetical protein